MNNKLYYIWLSLATGPASRLAPLLLSRYKSPKNIYDAPPSELSDFCAELRMKLPPELSDRSLEKSKRILAYCENNGISLITPASRDYPPALLRLIDLPILLYCKGRMPDLSRKLAVAVVGTRKMTDSGKNTAYKLGLGLALGGACVVSGAALGIDGCAIGRSYGGKAVDRRAWLWHRYPLSVRAQKIIRIDRGTRRDSNGVSAEYTAQRKKFSAEESNNQRNLKCNRRR